MFCCDYLACNKSLKLEHLPSCYCSVALSPQSQCEPYHTRTTHNHQIAMMAEVSFHVIESMIENKCADMEEEIVVQTQGNND